MKADDAEAAGCLEQLQTGIERRTNLTELVIDLDTQRLERACGWIFPRLANRNRFGDDLGELRRTCDRRERGRRHDCPCNSLCKSLLAVFTNHPCELLLGCTRDKRRGTLTRAVV